MKKIMMTLLMAAALTGQAMAQQNEEQTAQRPKFDKTEMIQRSTQHMAQRYGLDEAQTKKLLELNTAYAGKMGPGRGFGMGRPPRRMQGGAAPDSTQRPRFSREDMEKRMKEAQANREAYNKELKGIMTTEQYAKYEADAKKRSERPARRPQQDNN